MSDGWKASLIVISLCIIGTTLAPGAESIASRAAKLKADLTEARDKLLGEFDKMDTLLQSHGIASKNVAAGRALLDAMLKDKNAWSEVMERTTRRREAAEATLRKYLEDANKSRNAANNEYAFVRYSKQEELIRTDPKAAEVIINQRSVESAKREAFNARQEAEEAKRDAANAQAEARVAKLEAEIAANKARAEKQSAEREADEAKREADRNKETLERNGLPTW